MVLMMKCFVYKSHKKTESYIYINKKDNFEAIPDQLLQIFGKPEFALEFELTEDRKLASVDAKDVIESIIEHGYYLQMPPNNNLPV
jgi:uncharacterized protein YcgL (UPF0745 family)